jgi:hypothetical protein
MHGCVCSAVEKLFTLPGWVDIDVGLLRVSATDLLMSPESLLGRGALAVLLAIARASGREISQYCYDYAHLCCVKDQDYTVFAVVAIARAHRIHTLDLFSQDLRT